jgi:hypothetical protein
MEPMDHRRADEPGAVVLERLEGLERPASHLRSPIVEERTIDLAPLDIDRPSVEVPPVGRLIPMLAWAIVPAVPCLLLIGWQSALLAASVALLVREVDRRAGRARLLFADGFLRFEDDARAQGVQEENDVHWTWGQGGDGRAGGWRPPVVARIDHPLTAPPVMPRTK